MATESSDKLTTKFRQARNEKFCLECGAQMVEVGRRSEEGALFVWYECSRNDCDGQWLQKTPSRSDQR
jgi:hypothetical protein